MHPYYAAEIAAGRKKVEFRRRWSNKPTDVLVVYATAPIKAIVAIAEISEVRRAGNTQLWEICKSFGGAITRTRLREYMHDLDQGVALLLGRLAVPKFGINPREAFGGDFVPPQSYRYLRAEEVESLIDVFGKQQ
ncbi:ASCH domain-containing protein [Rhodoferax mekongensis]|uniref:ASCH domain-containing protein n=1 Tax=Rhodoferax mekongensis TaxID=3068341 RepID=UPI0028BF5822|nr:ASCH domain-containing protein [Rhodoferax sp. TBRC 17199]MDT7514366.1 ASCH domain-containing protein [Rhodoferax sp. TBRC 17199]